MRELKNTCRAAIVQATPVMFDKARSLEKALCLMDEAAANAAELIVFPELFLPGYPYGMTFGFTVGARNEDGRKDWQLYCDNSIVVPGPETERLAAADDVIENHTGSEMAIKTRILALHETYLAIASQQGRQV